MNDKTKPVPPTDPLKNARILSTQSRRDHSDVLGSYTGTDADGEAPEQDVDDL